MFGFLLAGVGDHLGTGLRNAVTKIEMLFLVRRAEMLIMILITNITNLNLPLHLY